MIIKYGYRSRAYEWLEKWHYRVPKVMSPMCNAVFLSVPLFNSYFRTGDSATPLSPALTLALDYAHTELHHVIQHL